MAGDPELSPETRHTPGPWMDWENLEWLYEPHKLLTETANARLIAAAPELLMFVMAAAKIDREAAPNNQKPMIDFARALVAKATEP